MKKSAKKIAEPVSNSKAGKHSGKEKTGIKYADKSAGQPQLIPIFQSVKKLFLPWKQKGLDVQGGKDGQMLLICGTPEKEIHFAGLLIQKGYVGFYLSALKLFPELKKEIQPELLNCLKGKTCFYLRKNDKEIYAQIKNTLDKAGEAYRKQGWIA